MEPEQNSQALSSSKNGQHSERLMSVDTDETDELSNRGLNLLRKSIAPSIDTDELEDPKNKGLNLRPLWRTIQRNVLLIAGVTTTIASAGLYSSLNSPHIYEGNFRLLVEPITSEARFTDPSVLSRGEGVATTISIDYPSLLQILQSPGLLSKIANRVQARYPDFNYSLINQDLVTKNLVIQRVGTNLSDITKLIEVRYKGEDPTKVQFILTEIAQEYLKYGLENRKTRISSGVQFIEDQLPALQKQVNDLQGKVQVLRQRYKLTDPATNGAELYRQLHAVQAQKFDVQRELREQKTLSINLQKQLELATNELLAASTLSEDPNYQALLTQLKRIESQVAVASAQFTEESPTIQSLREQQKKLSLLLNQEAQRIARQTLPSRASNPQVLNFQNSTRQALIRQLIEATNNSQVLEVRNQAITKAEADLNQQLEQFPVIIRQYNDLQGQLEIATNTLNQLLTQRETLRVEAAQKEVPWGIASEPLISRDSAGNPIPLPRDTTKKLAMGVFAGLVLGLGAALLREKYRNVFYTYEDIQDAIMELPVLEVPLNRSARQFSDYAASQSIAKTGSEGSNASLLLEAFSSLYTSIHFLAPHPPVRSLVVCSAEPGDGKTTIALHLAKAAARMGQRVLLVDANLFQPEIHTRLGLPNSQGLSNILSENLEPKDFIQQPLVENNLFVLTAGQSITGSSKLLASTRIQHLIKQFQSNFDLVIYDTPHLLDFADTNFLAARTDGILMVVRVGKTNRSAAMQVLNKLKSFHLPILSIVATYVNQNKESSDNSQNHYYEQNPQFYSTSKETETI